MNIAEHERSRGGRRELRYAAAAVLLALGAWTVQLAVFHRLTTPWYVPILGAIGALLAAFAFFRAPGWTRKFLALVVILIGGFEVFFVVRGSLLPVYEGPLSAGLPFPAFAAQRSDGAAFTDNDLRGQQSILVFFRGRW